MKKTYCHCDSSNLKICEFIDNNPDIEILGFSQDQWRITVYYQKEDSKD